MSDRVEVLVGPGTVIRSGRVTAWAGPTASLALVGFLRQSLCNVGPSERGGQLLVDHVAGILAGRDPEPQAAFAAVGPAETGWVAILHGPAQLWDGSETTTPPPNVGWARVPLVPNPLVAVGPAGSPAPRLVSGPPYDLVEGTVPGGGFMLVTGHPGGAGSPPSPAPPLSRGTPAGPGSVPEPTDAPALPEGAELVALGSTEPQGYRPLPGVAEPAAPGSGPIVDLTYCPAGHPNHPALQRCARCRAAITPRASERGHRPPLGVLLADDGTVYRLDGDLLIGSDPAADPEVTRGRFGVLRLTSPVGSLAPVHAEIRISGWEPSITDRGSANGTHLVRAGTEDWERLTPFRPEPLEPGSHVSLGQRVLTFVSPWPLQQPR